MMSNSSIGLSSALAGYLGAHSTSPDEVQAALIAETADLGRAAGMQIAPEQGELLSLLVSLIQPTFVVEVGTFTGYSALAIAKGMGAQGRLLCCDVSETWTEVARRHWELAGVAERIELRVAPAAETLAALDTDVVIDMAFIDADKGGYITYYEEILSRLAPKGVICVDNTLWGGAVIDADNTSDDTEAIRRFNAHVAEDARTRQVIVPIGDGLTLIRRA